MCEPATLMAASLAISAVGAGAAHDSGRKTANRQADAIKEASELQALDTAREQSQTAAAGAEQMNEWAKRAQAQMASFDTIAGEYGGGNSIDRSRAVMGIQANERLATIGSNTRARLNESAASSYAARTRSTGQIRALPRPSIALTALQIGGSAVEAYDRFGGKKTTTTRTK